MTSSHPTAVTCQWFSQLARPLDRRSAPRLALLFLGAILARGRRTVTSWIRAAGLSGRFQSCYIAVAAAGKRADSIAARLALEVVKPLVEGGGRLTLALDDTPTKRYGPHVQGAGVHHNPAPGPAGSPYVYGHVFVVLGLLVAHPAWGAIALPLLARLYVRKKDLPVIDPKHRPAFRTKLELAVELLRWAKVWLGLLGKPIWVVADGVHAEKDFLKPAAALAMTVVSRLRKDAALRGLPAPRAAGRRGRPRIYGPDVIDLAKRGGQRRGWTSGRFTLYGVATVKRYKTFLATWRPAGGVIRVVLVDEPTGWRAYFCTDTQASVADILSMIADRFSLDIDHPDYHPSARWVSASNRAGYDRHPGALLTLARWCRQQLAPPLKELVNACLRDLTAEFPPRPPVLTPPATRVWSCSSRKTDAGKSPGVLALAREPAAALPGRRRRGAMTCRCAPGPATGSHPRRCDRSTSTAGPSCTSASRPRSRSPRTPNRPPASTRWPTAPSPWDGRPPRSRSSTRTRDGAGRPSWADPGSRGCSPRSDWTGSGWCSGWR